jgi:hypothetical protein
VSKKNEDYHGENMRRTKAAQQSSDTRFGANSIRRPNPNYDPSLTLGLDPELGDIIFEPSEIPVIRGGWIDRNDIVYQDTVDGLGMKSVNIYKKGSIDSKNRPS